MSRDIFLPNNHTQKDWDDAMNSLCKCDHLFYQHAFTMHPSFDDAGGTVLRSSQCMFCPYDREKDEFTCKGFNPK